MNCFWQGVIGGLLGGGTVVAIRIWRDHRFWKKIKP